MRVYVTDASGNVFPLRTALSKARSGLRKWQNIGLSYCQPKIKFFGEWVNKLELILAEAEVSGKDSITVDFTLPFYFAPSNVIMKVN